MARIIAKIVNGVITEKGDLDQFAVKVHSKRSCRSCHERGWHYYSMVDGSAEVRTCECVERSLARAARPTRELVYAVIRPDSVSKFYYGTASKTYTEVVEQH